MNQSPTHTPQYESQSVGIEGPDGHPFDNVGLTFREDGSLKINVHGSVVVTQTYLTRGVIVVERS